VCNPWPDIDALKGVLAGEPLADGLIGTDGPDTIRNGEDYPWWFPSCYESCIAVEEQLRSYYNERLDGGADIVYDYLLPQSMYHSVQYRRFQFELLHADPRYRGYTTNVVRDIPFLRGGLLTYTGEPRYPREWWDWHGDHMQPQVTAAEVAERPAGQPLAERVPELLYFKPEWSGLIDRETPLYYLESGYQELAELVAEWPMAEPLPHSAVAGLDPTDPHGRSVVLTSVLTYDLVDYIERGGAVVLFASKWPGGLGSYPVHHWRSAAFFPPVGPWAQQLPQDMAASPGGTAAQLALDLHQFDLTVEHTSQVAVGDLGLIEYVDPLVRLFDTHDLREVKQRDQLFMSRVGDGLLAVTCLNHATAGGQWVLGEVVAWADEFAAMGGADAAGGEMFPWARMPLEKARELATARPNAIILLDDPWRFRLDEAQAGEAAGWMNPDFAVDDWDWINVASSWESEGYSYDGMAWYRTEVDIPAEWDGARVKLIAEGIDDAYVVWVNGEAVAKHGSFTVHEETVWQLQTESDISDYIIPGENNTLVLQVVDITGGGGVWKPLYLAVEEQSNNE
jgi:hypothetical protein